jgi:CheY-like chemotaxis protein
VASKEGEGTTVTLEIALAWAEPRPFRSGSGESDAQPARSGAGAPRTVLLVEDNPINQMVATEMLQQLGCEVSQAETGTTAVTCATSRRFDLVLMDWQLPEMDGLEAIRRIRAFERVNGRARVPIYSLTANAMPGDAEKCVAAGADGYLAKPFNFQQLRALIENSAAAAPSPLTITGK